MMLVFATDAILLSEKKAIKWILLKSLKRNDSLVRKSTA